MAINLEFLGRYSTGVFDEGAAEISAYDPTTQRLFVVNANAGNVDVLDLNDPGLPVPATTDDGNPIVIGLSDANLPNNFAVGGINSVAVKDGVIAIAVEADNSQANGVVAFYTVGTINTAPGFLSAVEVGALPDMVTFTPDGNKVLVANEGEPSDDYSVDPEGSISIIDISGGVDSVTSDNVAIASFTGFNDQLESLRGQGVRIFGPNATVAQDLEPEYITVSSDSETAYVALQENNALAVVDLINNEVTEILPLGFKDQSLAPTLTTSFFEDEELPVIGTSETQGDIRLSGFSGLYFEGVNEDNGNLQFITHPDLGPTQTGNADVDEDGTEERVRTYLLPNLQPRFVRFEYNPNNGELSIVEQVLLTDQNGNPLTGRPNLETDDSGRIPIDEQGNILELDPLGADLEGIVRAPDGTYWLSDEYRPAIYHFQADGTLIERYVPEGLPEEVGTGVFPEVYNQRRANRGFEAIAYQDGKVYAFIQTPINNPESRETSTIRILEFDPETEAVVGEYLYLQDDMGGGSDKIGDAVALSETGEFLVIERDSGLGPDSVKNIYRIDLTNATNVLNITLTEEETLEGLSPEELDARGIEVVSKELYADLAALGYTFTDKPEGLALVDADTVAVINDNDFGETGIPVGLGLLNLNTGIDPSDRDSAIDIQPVPVLGMYQPDAIALFNTLGEDLIITANEGDSRDYDGFSEEARVKDLVLDPVAFPNAAELQQDENLGRLEVTTTLGDIDGDGDYDKLYAYGGRSFSIWDNNGELLFDSGTQLEEITAEAFPEFFNSDNDENTFDTRSDAKGPEPEGVTVGEINGTPYGFIGLERVGGVAVYDLTNPFKPEFIQYINQRDFTVAAQLEDGSTNPAVGDLGPEGLTFISAEDSPNGEPLLVVTNEVSGTTSVFGINVDPVTLPDTAPIYDIQGEAHISPFLGATVTTSGIVTAVDSNGFYLQDSFGDGNEATSDALFVFTGGSPGVAVGDEVELTGEVSEFTPGGLDTRNLSTTQIAFPDQLNVISSGNDLPDAVILGSEGRLPPTQVIDNDNFDVFDPDQDGIDFYESLEGMLVTVPSPTVVGPTNRFGEVLVIPNGLEATGLSDRGTLNISPDDFNPERIQIADDSTLSPFDTPEASVGAVLSDVTGVYSYSFGSPEILFTEAFSVVTQSPLEPEVTELIGSENRLTVAAYNVLNLDPNDNDGDDDIAEGQFGAIAEDIVTNLQTPDIIALQEIQDNTGSDRDGVTAADQTLQLLVDEIATISGVTYEFLDNPFIGEDTSGGQPGGNIRNAFLYNPNRVDFVENSLDTVVDPSDQQTNPANPFFDSRLPLVANFSFNGEEVTVISNHFSSKGGSAPLFGAVQPATQLQNDVNLLVNGSLDERIDQAQALKDYIDGILATNPEANIIAAGDFNEFEFIEPLEILETSLVNLTETLPPNERYSFIFEGNSQSLDHILVSPNLANEALFDAVHVNSEFADSQQASDHDPLIASLELATEPAFTLQILHTADQEAGLAAVEDAVNFSAVIEGLADDFANTLRLSSGDIYIPGPFFNASDEIYGEPGIGDILINNALGFQAVAFGNHEFDQGTGVIETLIEANPDITGPGIGEGGYQGTAFPYLSTNLDFSTDENLADLVVPGGQAPQPNSISNSVVIDVNGESIGVVGATTPILDSISNPGGVGVLPEDFSGTPTEAQLQALAAIIQAEVDALTNEGINKVVLLSHFQQIGIEEQVAQLLTDVDVVMAGGSNTLLANEDDPLRDGDTAADVYPIELMSASGEPVALINTDGNYQYVGRLALEFDANGVITNILEESGAYATDDTGVDRVYGEDVNAVDVANPVVVEVTEAIANITLEADGNIFGLTDVFLNGTRGDVRTQETNLGNLTADANLFYADQFDETVTVSIKNGGGIRDNIGVAVIPPGGTSNELELLPPQANSAAGKEEGEISQLDIENTLRFNNELTLLTVTAQELDNIMEYAVSATAEGATPGQFPQISGLQFSFDPDNQAIVLNDDGSVMTEGERVQNLTIMGNDGEEMAIVEEGELVADADMEIRLVTLNFLAGGGDGYPFDVYGENVVNLAEQFGDQPTSPELPADVPNEATFTNIGTEQDALAEYLFSNFREDSFAQEDTPPSLDERIQNLNFRDDTVLEGVEPEPELPMTVFGSPNADFFDTEILDDKQFLGDNQFLFAGSGDDYVDVTFAPGGNRIDLGSGDDFLFGGTDNRIIAGSGDDILFVGSAGGNNVITGGSGMDQFWIVTDSVDLPVAANIITDFTIGDDVIGFGSTNLSFEDLALMQEGSNTVINALDQDLAILRNTQASSLSESDFFFA